MFTPYKKAHRPEENTIDHIPVEEQKAYFDLRGWIHPINAADGAPMPEERRNELFRAWFEYQQHYRVLRRDHVVEGQTLDGKYTSFGETAPFLVASIETGEPLPGFYRNRSEAEYSVDQIATNRAQDAAIKRAEYLSAQDRELMLTSHAFIPSLEPVGAPPEVTDEVESREVVPV